MSKQYTDVFFDDAFINGFKDAKKVAECYVLKNSDDKVIRSSLRAFDGGIAITEAEFKAVQRVVPDYAVVKVEV